MRKQASGGLGTYSSHVFLKFPDVWSQEKFHKCSLGLPAPPPTPSRRHHPLEGCGAGPKLRVRTWARGLARSGRWGRRAQSGGRAECLVGVMAGGLSSGHCILVRMRPRGLGSGGAHVPCDPLGVLGLLSYGAAVGLTPWAHLPWSLHTSSPGSTIVVAVVLRASTH